MFIDLLIEKIKEKNNPTVAGLDPQLDYIPSYIVEKYKNKSVDFFEACAGAIYEFNTTIIDSICDLVPAVKLQLACYEMYGVQGMACFQKTIRYAKDKGLLVIADGKRNDIGSTAKAYSAAYLGKTNAGGLEYSVFDVDALTVNPYLGYDGIEPFIEDCKKYGKGIFVLVKTSNKSSGQLQDVNTQDGRFIYEIIADYVNKWGSELTGKYGYSSVGAVVGATYPEQAFELRKLMKSSYILVPGYGAQGGTARDAAKSFNKDGLGAIVNSSRGIMCAYKSEKWRGIFNEDSFGNAAKAEVIDMRDKLNNEIDRLKSC